MKRLCMLLLIISMLFIFTACGAIDDLRTNQAEDILNPSGFEIVEKLGKKGTDYYVFLVYDTTTKVEYIFTYGNGTNGFCPYYDENGNVVIYEGD